MTDAAPRPRTTGRLLLAAIATGFAVRAVAAWVVERVARGKGRLCLFDDTAIYWQLAGAIRRGAPYVVLQWDVPHFALRTPGYPLFLAACRAAFGEGTLPIRLAQAALGAGAVGMIYALVRRARPGAGAGIALIAAALAAIDPYSAGVSALLLSEAIFVPLMVASLWGLAALWPSAGSKGPGRGRARAGDGGALGRGDFGQAVVGALRAGGLDGVGRDGRREAFSSVAQGRDGRTGAGDRDGALVGAECRGLRAVRPDGALARGQPLRRLHPGATGASAMEFLDAPDVRALGEVEQDAELRRRAWAFAREHPGDVARLAVVKAGRYWSPGPMRSRSDRGGSRSARRRGRCRPSG